MPLKTFCLFIYIFATWPASAQKSESINPVLGDISYIKKYHREPNKTDDENTRIVTHLEHVHQLLSQRKVSSLPSQLKKNRKYLLSMLRRYINERQFPKNYDRPENRRPCFIDKDGNICAVGSLIEKSVGRRLAEKINAGFQYAAIKDIKSPELFEWVKNSGLTAEECEMIQPFYGTPAGVEKYLGFHAGANYRIPSAISGNFAISYSRIEAIKRKVTMTTLSAFYELRGANTFSTGVKYAFGLYPVRRKFFFTDYFFQPYAAIGPSSYFEENDFHSIYIKPEIGTHLTFLVSKFFNPSLHLSYGYDILVYHKQQSPYSRHCIGLLLGTSFKLPKNRKLSRPLQ